MLSFGSAAFTVERGLIDTFSANLELLPGATPDPVTKTEFWDKQPEAWAACRQNLRSPHEAMQTYVKWVKSLPGNPVFVGYPATYDFMFMYHYLLVFAGESPFKRNMPKEWFPSAKHTHVAVDDAIEQGELFLNILKASRKGKRGA